MEAQATAQTELLQAKVFVSVSPNTEIIVPQGFIPNEPFCLGIFRNMTINLSQLPPLD